MLPPRTTAAGPAASTAAVSDAVVVLPLVPVTPMVVAGQRRRKRSISLTTGTTARLLDLGQRLAQPRLGRREAAADRRRGGDQCLIGQRLAGVDLRPQHQTRAAVLDQRQLGRQLLGRTRVIDGHLRTPAGQEARQGDAAARQAEHGHRTAVERVEGQPVEVDRGGCFAHHAHAGVTSVEK